jgi:hypothetical protein
LRVLLGHISPYEKKKLLEHDTHHHHKHHNDRKHSSREAKGTKSEMNSARKLSATLQQESLRSISPRKSVNEAPRMKFQLHKISSHHINKRESFLQAKALIGVQPSQIRASASRIIEERNHILNQTKRRSNERTTTIEWNAEEVRKENKEIEEIQQRLQDRLEEAKLREMQFSFDDLFDDHSENDRMKELGSPNEMEWNQGQSKNMVPFESDSKKDDDECYDKFIEYTSVDLNSFKRIESEISVRDKTKASKRLISAILASTALRALAPARSKKQIEQEEDTNNPMKALMRKTKRESVAVLQDIIDFDHFMNPNDYDLIHQLAKKYVSSLPWHEVSVAYLSSL